jgi:predicted secreted protein
MSISKPLLFAGVLLLALIVLACGDDDDDGGADDNGGGAAAEVQVTDADDGATVQVALNGTLIVALTSNPSTGFAWHVEDPSPAQLRLEGEPAYVPPGSTTTPVVGAAGTEVFTFTAVEAGTAELVLVYERSFETVPPERTYTLTVEVE